MLSKLKNVFILSLIAFTINGQTIFLAHIAATEDESIGAITKYSVEMDTHVIDVFAKELDYNLQTLPSVMGYNLNKEQLQTCLGKWKQAATQSQPGDIFLLFIHAHGLNYAQESTEYPYLILKPSNVERVLPRNTQYLMPLEELAMEIKQMNFSYIHIFKRH